jgi:hypothetical protein
MSTILSPITARHDGDRLGGAVFLLKLRRARCRFRGDGLSSLRSTAAPRGRRHTAGDAIVALHRPEKDLRRLILKGD